ncbi:MAG: YitT family protein, partial [Clostridium sp.]|nr:YitT family protein [Clostridium sp.]
MRNFKKYILITFGVLLVAISLEYFFYPNNIASGGVSGIALILNKLFNIPASLSMIVFNIILFVIAFIFLGSNYGIKSLYSATVLSIFMGIIEDVIIPIQITNDLIMATIFGSAILALG